MYLKRNFDPERKAFFCFFFAKGNQSFFLGSSLLFLHHRRLSLVICSLLFFKLTTRVRLRRVICSDFAPYLALCGWGFSSPDFGPFWGGIYPCFEKYAKINHCNFLIITLCCQWKDADIQGRDKFHRRKYVFLNFFPWGLRVLSPSFFFTLYILTIWKIAKVCHSNPPPGFIYGSKF